MRAALWVALAFAGGLALSALAMQPAREGVTAESFSGGLAPARPLSVAQVRSGIDAPTWNVGDAWRLRFGAGDPVCSLVVVDANESGYRQGVACSTQETDLVATQLAASGSDWVGDITPTLGVRNEIGTAEFYAWPLTDGKSWSTTLDGADAVVTAKYATVDGPSGKEPGYDLHMDVGGRTLIAYNYVPSLKWWSRIAFPLNAPDFVVKVVGQETAWKGPVVAGRAQTRFESTAAFLTPAGPQASTFVMLDTDTTLVLSVIRPGVQAGHFSLTDPAGNQAVLQVGTTNSGQTLGQRYDPAYYGYLQSVPGTWTIQQENVGIAGAYIRARGVSLQTIVL